MGMSPQMPHRLNKLSASDCHAVLKKKKICLIFHTYQAIFLHSFTQKQQD